MRIVTEQELRSRLASVAVDEPRVVASGNFATPQHLLSLLDDSLERYRLFMLNAALPVPERDGVVLETPFVGPGMRRAREHLAYVPMRLSLVPHLFRRSLPPDVVVVHVSPIRSGRVSLGIEVNIIVAAIEQARARGGLVVAQVNPKMPYTFGDGEIDCELIDFAIEVEEDLPSAPKRPASELAAQIGENVATFVGDGATLQLGIGAVPDATVGAVRGRRGLAIWSEMISDGVLDLEHAGAMDPSRPVFTSFMFGSPELYAWADGNPRLQMLRTETSNDPSMIARQPGMVSINSALQVDLYAQSNASWVGTQIYSGFGGQPDFTTGALHSHGGHAVIALASWHEKSAHSTIVPEIPTPVTSFQHSALVTEHGSAQIFGSSLSEQTRQIIGQIAHPDARDELADAARELGLF